MTTKTFLRRIFGILILAIGIAGAPAARAAVYLEFSGQNGVLEIVPGGSFQVTLNLVTTAEEVVGLDYKLQVGAGASGYLTLTGRNLGGSAFADPVETNATALAPAVAVMNPQNGVSLGAWTMDILPVATGTWQVAVFTILAAPDLAPGSYSFQTVSPAGAGWFGPDFEDHDFDSHGSLTLEVVPEPQVVGLCALAAGMFLFGRRKCFRVVAVLALFAGVAEAQTWPDYEYRQFNSKMNYRLCKPKNYDSSGATKYPLVIYWHGNGDTDTVSNFVVGDPTQCNSKQMSDCGQFAFMSEENQAIFPCFLVLPQRKTADGVDTNTPAHAAGLIDALAAEFRIDTDRVIVTGLSGGGGRTLACAMANPTKYAAVVPLSTILPNSANAVAASIKNLPIWFFHSVNDGTVGIGSTSDSLVAELRKAGARPIYTRYALGNHTPAMWQHCYRTPPLIPWIAKQRRGQAQQGDPARVVILSPTSAPTYASPTSVFALAGVVETLQPGTLHSAAINKVEWAKGDYHISSNHNPAMGVATWLATTSTSVTGATPTAYEAVAIGTTWAPDYLGATYYSATLLATYSAGSDATLPSVNITSPTTKETWKTKATTIKLAGRASDPVGGIARVEWRNNRGGSGTAAGTTQWQVASIPLVSGENILTIRALDASGNAGTDTLVVTNDRPADATTSLWTGTNIGEGSTPGVFPGVPGSFYEGSGTMTIRGSGSTMWGTDNQYYFVQQPVSGDFQMVARIISQEAAGQGSAGGTNFAGIVVADNLTRYSRYAGIGASGNDRASYRSHYGPNDTWGGSGHYPEFAPPLWLRLTRIGNAFQSYVSKDGSNWTAIVANDNIGMAGNAYLGFGVYSADNNVVSTAVFDNISITKGTAPVLLGASSRMTHGAAGNFDVDLPLSGSTGVESRVPAIPGGFSIRLTFDRPIASASASVQSGTGSVVGTSASGNTVIVSLGSVTNAQKLTVKLQNVVPLGGGVTGTATAAFAVLVGDANASAGVTAADAALVKSSAGKPVDNTTFRCDVDADGDIDAQDFAATKSRLGTTVP